MENTNAAQLFAVVAGAFYAALGVVGFAFTGFTGVVTDGGDNIIGFDLNIFHNVVHLAIGFGFLIASRLDATITQGIVIGGGLVYILAALLGFLNELQILSIDSSVSAINFFHLVSGSAAVLFGLIGARQTDAEFDSGERGGGHRSARA